MKNRIQKVLLVAPPFQPDAFYKKGFFNKQRQVPLFPFGVAYIAAYLKKFGYEVEILDIYASLLQEKEVIEELKKRTFDMVGISALVTQYKYVKNLAGTIKQITDVPVILGNGLATSCHRLILENVPSIDICVRGEGEITFKEVIENQENLPDILGISFRDQGGKVVVNPGRPIYQGEFPRPLYEMFDLSLYSETRMYDTGILDIREKPIAHKVFPALTSRGCPFHCNFCSKVIPTGRLRAVGNIINEISYLKDNHGIDGIHFIDELFAVSKKRAIELSRVLKPLQLLWDCQARCDTIDYETLKIMKDAGCVAIGLGIESGSQKILDNMNKKITVRQTEDAMIAARKLGCPVKVQLIFGYPGESYATLKKTVNLFKRIGHPGRRMSPILPVPGTKVYEFAKEKGLIKDEVEYLQKMGECWDRLVSVFNLTDMQDLSLKELDALKKQCEEKIMDNYLFFMLHHPLKLARALTYKTFRGVLLIRILKKVKIYHLARGVRRRLEFGDT